MTMTLGGLAAFLGAIAGGIFTYYATTKAIRAQAQKDIISPFISLIDEIYRLVEIYTENQIDWYFLYYFQELYQGLMEILFKRGGLFLILHKNPEMEDGIKKILQYIRGIRYEIIQAKGNIENIDQKEIREIMTKLLNTKNDYNKNIKEKLTIS